MGYNMPQATSLSYERSSWLYRSALLILGSAVSLSFIVNLLKTNENMVVVSPVSIYKELATSINDTLNTPVNIKDDLTKSPLIDSQSLVTPSTNADTTLANAPANIEQQVLAIPQTKTAIVHRHDSIKSICHRLGITLADERRIMSLPQAYPILSQLREDQQVEAQFSSKGEFMSLHYHFSKGHVLVIQSNGAKLQSEVLAQGMDERLRVVTIAVGHSITTAIKHAGLNTKLATGLMHIFSAESRVGHALRPGSHLTLLYQQYYKNGRPFDTGQIVAAKVISRDDIYEAVVHQFNNGQLGYYTPSGQSLERSFLRAPVHYEYVSSSFDLHRYHPLLHIVRPHYGVDLAAQSGTPIMAAGDGAIKFMGRKGGYGNVVMISHDSSYSTLYAHMARFASGIHDGSHVKEGQVIGYVGATGLASGAHLHYEVRINDKPVNPLTVALPHANPIPRTQLASFKDYAKRVDSYME